MQETLFLDSQPLARSSDPVTSHLAAEKFTKSGKRQSQKQMVLDAVRSFPGRTSAELANLMRVSRYLPARRLPDLKADGLIVVGGMRECRITGERSLTWRSA